MAAPLCLFWTLWNERNMTAFENKTPSIHRLKSPFVCTLWSWAKLNSIGNLDYLVDFLTWLGYRRVVGFLGFSFFVYLYCTP